MGRKSRDKGYRIENEIVNALNAAGVPSQRVPLSGSAGGAFTGDVVLNPPGRDPLRAEVKARGQGDGFKLIGCWLADNDLLFLRRDKAAPLVLLPLDQFLKLLRLPTPTDGPDPVEVASCNSSSEADPS